MRLQSYSRDYPGNSPSKSDARMWFFRTARDSVAHQLGALVLLGGPEPERDLKLASVYLRWNPRRVLVVDRDTRHADAMRQATSTWGGDWALGDVGEIVASGGPVSVAYLDFCGLNPEMMEATREVLRKVVAGGVIGVTWFCSREFPGRLSHEVKVQRGRGSWVRGFCDLMEELAREEDAVLEFLGSRSYAHSHSSMTTGAWRRRS